MKTISEIVKSENLPSVSEDYDDDKHMRDAMMKMHNASHCAVALGSGVPLQKIPYCCSLLPFWAPDTTLAFTPTHSLIPA